MNASPPLLLLLAAGPDDPGAAALLAHALDRARDGCAVRVLLSHAGLGWARDERLGRGDGRPGITVGVCSRQARDAGWTLETAPDGIAWSALIAWLRDARSVQAVWTALP